jgi:hypothetical protein
MSLDLALDTCVRLGWQLASARYVPAAMASMIFLAAAWSIGKTVSDRFQPVRRHRRHVSRTSYKFGS